MSDETGVPEDQSQTPEDGQNIFGEKLAQRSQLVVMADAALAIEGIRVAAQVRLNHLAKRGAICLRTTALLRRLQELEDWADTDLADLVLYHPTAHWFTRVNGTGGELIGKVLGHIEKFGRFYDLGDPMIPWEVKRNPITITVKKGVKEEEKQVVWVAGIERLLTQSKLHKYAGLIEGQRPEAGKKIGYNAELRTILFRLGVSLLKQKGQYFDFYIKYKAGLLARFERQGIKVMPTPMERTCIPCAQVVKLKSAKFCPECGGKLTLKTEPENVRWEGHVHMMAMRWMIKLFADHLWEVWRKAENLSVRPPYAMEYLGHTTIITPWEMCDREEVKKPKKIKEA